MKKPKIQRKNQESKEQSRTQKVALPRNLKEKGMRSNVRKRK
jgi:hypothetical protein